MDGPTLDQVCEALSIVYGGKDCAVMKDALQWLESFKKSVNAWNISDQLLSQHKSVEFSSFASQTLRAKIKFQFQELPQSAHGDLRNSLITHLSHEYSQIKSIRTQLCLGLVDLALQATGWSSFVEYFFEMFKGNPDVLIEILTFIPEEITDSSLRLGIGRRNEVLSQLQDSFEKVHAYMMAFLESNNNEMSWTKAFNMLSVWFYVKVVPEQEVISSAFWSMLFSILKSQSSSDELHRAAADCLSDVVTAIEDVNKYPNLSTKLLDAVLDLVPTYQSSKGDFEKSMSYCRVFSYMAESFHKFIILSPGKGLGKLEQLEVMLECLSHPNYEVARFTFHFWMCFGEVMHREYDEQRNIQFAPYVMRAIQLVTALCQLDPSRPTALSRNDEFYEFRLDASDCVKDIAFIVGSPECFTKMFEIINACDGSWTVTEAALFIMVSLALNIVPDEDQPLSSVMSAILSMPSDAHPQLRLTGVEMFGQMAEWTGKHPQYIADTLTFLVSFLNQSTEMAAVAAASLEKLCDRASSAMTDHFSPLLAALGSVEGILPAELYYKLLKGVAGILSEMPQDKIKEGFLHLTQIQTMAISQVVSAEPELPDGDLLLIDRLERLSIIWRQMKVKPHPPASSPHPCSEAVSLGVSMVYAAFNTRSATRLRKSRERLAEKCCKCLRFAVRCLRSSHFQPLLSDARAFIVKSYVDSGGQSSLTSPGVGSFQSYDSCWLYVASVLVDEFGGKDGHDTMLLETFSALAGPTLELLKQSTADSPTAFTQSPDVVDDFFRLALRLLQRIPTAVGQAGDALGSLVDCSMAGLGLEHRDAVTSIVKFLSMVVSCCDPTKFPSIAQSVTLLVCDRGPKLTFALLKAVVISLPYHVFLEAADVFSELKQKPTLSQALNGWVIAGITALLADPAVSHLVVDNAEIDRFYQSFSGETEPRKIMRLLSDFRRFFT